MTLRFNHEKYRNDRKKVCSSDELARRLGIEPHFVITLEHGRKKTATLTDYKQMCDAVGLDVNDYVTEDNGEPKVITFLTNKGGAGKTTAAINIAGSLAFDYGKKVLVIDTDLQQNSTQHLGMLYPEDESPEEIERFAKVLEDTKAKNIYNAIMKQDDIQNHILHTKWDNIDVVVSCDAMAKIDEEIFFLSLRELQMQRVLEKLIKENWNGYDYIIIDCNPTLSQFNKAVLFASDYLMIPLEASAFGLRGVQYIFDFYDSVKTHRSNLEILGILLNKIDNRKNITKEMTALIESNKRYKKCLLDTTIPVDTSIEQAQSYGEPLFVSFRKSKAYKAYKEATKEILKKMGDNIIGNEEETFSNDESDNI